MLPDQPVQPIGLLEDRLQELPSLRRVEPHLDLQQARHRGLDRREGRAEVVRHRGEQRGPRLAPSPHRAGRPRSPHRGGRARGRRRSGSRPPRAAGGPRERAPRGPGATAVRVPNVDLAARDRHLDGDALGRAGPRPHGPRTCDPPRWRSDRAARQAERIDERRRQIVQHAIQRLARERLGREQVQEPGLALATGRAVAFGDRAGHHPSHEQGHHEEDHERDHVVPVVDAEGVERLGEEVVEGQEAEHRAADPRPDPSGDRRGHDGQQEQRDRARARARAGRSGRARARARGPRPRSRRPAPASLRPEPAPTARSCGHATASLRLLHADARRLSRVVYAARTDAWGEEEAPWPPRLRQPEPRADATPTPRPRIRRSPEPRGPVAPVEAPRARPGAADGAAQARAARQADRPGGLRVGQPVLGPPTRPRRS